MNPRLQPPAGNPDPSPVEFAAQELIACWDQSYEALGRGDIDRVSTLFDLAEEHLLSIGSLDRLPDTLQQQAVSARGRLEHGMRAGLDALRQEMARARQGEKALRGYGNNHRTVPTPSGLLT